jgi:hypothetical protein
VIWNPLFPPILVFAALVAMQLILGRTAYRYETLSSALLYCAYGLLCFVVVQCLRRTSQVKMLATIFPAYGFAVALFALIQSMSSSDKLYWLRTPRSGGWIYGPYVNHNHYAGLTEMLAPIPLVFALTRNAHGPRRTIAAIAAAVMAGTIFLYLSVDGSRRDVLSYGKTTTRQIRWTRPKPLPLSHRLGKRLSRKGSSLPKAVQIFTTPELGFGNIFIHKAKSLRNNLLASVACVMKWPYSCFRSHYKSAGPPLCCVEI